MASHVKGHKAAFFVEVQDPITLRKSILQCLRDILGTIQKFNTFQHKKEQKKKKIMELRTIINRTNMLFWKLKTALPDASFKEQKQSKQQKKQKAGEQQPQFQQQVTQAPPKQRSELDMLEAELAAIEKKLNRLA